MSNKESQKDEICVLESIYNEEEIQTHEENGLLGGQFYAHIDLPTGFKVIFRDLRKEDSGLEELPLKYLPPLSLHFSLPEDYPSHLSPTYTLSCQWLENSKLMLLRTKLDEIWKENEGMEVLFLWTQFLKEEALKFLKITDILDVSSLETAYIKHKEVRQAMKAHQFTVQEKERNEKYENSKINVPSKHLDTSATCSSVAKYSRRKQRGRSRWGRRDRVVNKLKQEDVKAYETEAEKCVIEKIEAMTTSTQDTEAVRDNGSNSEVFFNSKNQQARNWAQRSYHRGTYGRRYNYYYNRSIGRGNDRRVSGCGYISVCPKKNDQIILNSKDVLKDNQSQKNSSECDNLVDSQCRNNNEAVNVGIASQDCIVDTWEKDVKVTLDGVESVDTREKGVKATLDGVEGVKSSESADVSRINNSLSLHSDMNGDSRSNAPTRPRMSVIQLLKEYNEDRQQTEFNRNFYACKICFQDKQGFQCTCFKGCGHVFCKSCVAEYFEVRIKDNNVKSMCCPEENCTSEAMPGQVQELVSAELFSRYDTALLSTLLDTMENVLYCPRPVCQYPVAVEPGEKMATCPSCAYAFCIYCKMVYHGIEPCKFRSREKHHLVEEYCNASEERRMQLEQRYGKKQLQNLVDTSLSENWLINNSKKCPTCSAAIEKSDGCNKMVCWKCNTFFCWLCEERLNPQSPYVHFNNPASKCYNLLFHGVLVSDDEDDGWWMAQGIFLENDDEDDDDDDDDDDSDSD